MNDPAPTAHAGLMLCVLLALVGFILVLQLGQTPPTENREIRIFNVIKGMLDSGDYLVPRINGKPHLTKPPLYYWLASAATAVSHLSARVAYRLPSVLGALGLIAATFWLCRVMGLARLALPAAMITSAFYEFCANARIANFEMLLSLFSLVSVIGFYQYMKCERLRWLLLAGLSFGLAFLTKATPAIAMVFIPVVLMFKFEGKLKLLCRPSVILFGIVLPILIGSVWLVLMLKLSPQARQVIKSEALLPFGVQDEDHHTAAHYQNPFFFVYKILKIAAPAILLLPLAIFRLGRTKGYRNECRELKWVLYSFAAVFVLFSAIPQKQEHYLLPVLPYLAIMLSDGLLSVTAKKKDQLTLRIGGSVIGVLALVMVPVLGFYFFKIIDRPLLAVLLSVLALAVGIALILLARRKNAAPLLVGALGGWFFFLLVYYGSFNVWDNQFKGGEIYTQPYYSKAHWDGLFEQYPKLKEIFNTSKRLLKNDPGN